MRDKSALGSSNFKQNLIPIYNDILFKFIFDKNMNKAKNEPIFFQNQTSNKNYYINK